MDRKSKTAPFTKCVKGCGTRSPPRGHPPCANIPKLRRSGLMRQAFRSCRPPDNRILVTQMVYRPRIDDKLCFVLMPFERPFDSYYQKIIKPAVSDAGLSALRSDEIYSTKTIVKDIWNRIWAARVVVADVTDRNPNVNYELGLCDALDVPTVIIT